MYDVLLMTCFAVDIDWCENHECVHGQCVDDIETYNCECERGYNGTFCEGNVAMQWKTENFCTLYMCALIVNTTDIIEYCYFDTCQFGDCIELIGDFACDCWPGLPRTTLRW